MCYLKKPKAPVFEIGALGFIVFRARVN